MANAAIEWAKDNPLLAGGAALAVVVVVMLVAGGGSEGEGDPNAGGMGAAGVQAYYAAVANQAQAGAAIQTTQIRAQAETNRALIAATYGLEVSKVQGGVQMAAIGAEERNNRGWIDLERERIASEERLGADASKVRLSIANLAGSTRLGKAQRGAVYQAAITGQVVPVNYKPVNPGNSAAGIINAGANLVGSVTKALPFL